MKATKIQHLIEPGPLDDFHDWLMSGKAFRKPVAFEHADGARELLRFTHREFREITLPGGKHVWFEVEAHFASIAGGLERR